MKDKIKVLEISHGLAPGGIEAFLLNIYENIDINIIQIDFAVATNGKQFHEDRVINQGAFVYHTSDLNGVINIAKHFIRLIKLLKKEGPFDVVHSHIDFMNGVNLLAAYIARVPLRISHAHNTNSAGGTSSKSNLKKIIYRKIMRSLILAFSNKLLGCSHDANKFMYGNRNSRKAIFIPNAVDFSKFSEIPTRFSNKKSKINFITIGRLCHQKNSLFIAEIIFELSKIRNDFKMNWIGTGPQEEQINYYINDNKLSDYFNLLGNRKDIPELLNESDFMIFPSNWEGLPVTLIEAQVSKTPCFISDKITEEANIGLCTVISLKKTAKEWALQIDEHITNETYNNEIDKKQLELFNINNVVKQIEKIYLNK